MKIYCSIFRYTSSPGTKSNYDRFAHFILRRSIYLVCLSVAMKTMNSYHNTTIKSKVQSVCTTTNESHIFGFISPRTHTCTHPQGDFRFIFALTANVIFTHYCFVYICQLNHTFCSLASSKVAKDLLRCDSY